MNYRILILGNRQRLQIFHWLLKAYPVLFLIIIVHKNNELPNFYPRKKTFFATLIGCFTFTRFHANIHESNVLLFYFKLQDNEGIQKHVIN